jgi:hypothetical protein
MNPNITKLPMVNGENNGIDGGAHAGRHQVVIGGSPAVRVRVFAS